ncbi:hypothetical protein F4780DRAFT_67356 [Xylariomycetidae sp. FL0641]|nr:hypothetical protein F4780DRAFT_67356 [Xylariomycetidae sp. FL0641]
MSEACNKTVTISSQDEADRFAAACPDGQSDPSSSVWVTNATGSLKFTGVPTLYNLTVTDNQLLEGLDFPQLTNLTRLTIVGAPALSRLSLPQLDTFGSSFDEQEPITSWDQLDRGLVLYLAETPKLGTILFKRSVGFDILTVYDQGGSGSEFSDNFFSNFRNVTYASYFSNTCDGLPNLRMGRLMALQHTDEKCTPGFPSLDSVSSLILNQQYSQLLDAQELDSVVSPRYSVAVKPTDQLQLENLRPVGLGIDGIDGMPPVPVAFNTTQSLASVFISGNVNIGFELDYLTNLDSALRFENNTSSSLRLSALKSASEISIIDNPNTTIPILPDLEQVNNIHMRGYIDTTYGPNIFPRLQYVSGNMTIEPWNDDFDCSKLSSLANEEQIINHLTCNGTNSVTPSDTNSSQSLSESPTLSTGAWAGVGVGAGIVLIGSIVAIVWLRLHYRFRTQQIARRTSHTPSPTLRNDDQAEPQRQGTREGDVRGANREKPKQTVHEVPENHPRIEIVDNHIREMPDDRVYELGDSVFELPSTPANRRF